MALEHTEHEQAETEVVQHIFSPVIEGISLLMLVVEPELNKLALKGPEVLESILSKESISFIKHWKRVTDMNFRELFNFLLPCPVYYDGIQFVEHINQLSDIQFLNHFFSEVLSEEVWRTLLINPSRIDGGELTILWDTDEKKSFIKDFISNLGQYRQHIMQLLREVYLSSLFLRSIQANKEWIDNAITEQSGIRMEPLALAQYIMGKTFFRTSVYKMFLFVPSYYFSPRRMRVFNSDVCIVIYGCATPLEDVRQKSMEIEAVLKALSDSNRLLILRMLTGQKEYGARLAEFLGITTATVSHHLDILKKAGLIQEEKIGTIKYFSCNKDDLEKQFQGIITFLTNK